MSFVTSEFLFRPHTEYFICLFIYLLHSHSFEYFIMMRSASDVLVLFFKRFYFGYKRTKFLKAIQV
jgi:hypothetical protein